MIDDGEKLPMDALDTSAPEPAPEQQPQDDAPQRERDEQGRFAPRQEGARGRPDSEAARRREAAERDEYRKKHEESEAKYQRLEKRLEDMAALARGDDPEAQKQPDPLAALTTKIDGIGTELKQDREAREAEQAWNSIHAYANQAEAAFRERTPDFPNAVQHYVASRLGEMKALGLAQEQAEAAFQREAAELLITSQSRGVNPAEMIYGLAQARGYNPGSMPQQQRQQPRATGGREPGTGGGSAIGGVTPQMIANMSDEDYAQFRSTPEGQRVIKQMMQRG